MEFLEELPVGCPPNSAAATSVDGAYRVVGSESPTIQDFLSHAALGIPMRPTTSACMWRSCSLFKSRDKALDLAGKLPKKRAADPHLAVVTIAPSDGKLLVNEKTTHIHLWLSTSFDPDDAIVDVEKVNV